MTKGFHYLRRFNARSAQMKMSLVNIAIKVGDSIVGAGHMEEGQSGHFYSQCGPSFMKDRRRLEVAEEGTLDNHLAACSYILVTSVDYTAAVHIYYVIVLAAMRSLLWLAVVREELDTRNCSRTMVSFEVGWDP